MTEEQRARMRLGRKMQSEAPVGRRWCPDCELYLPQDQFYRAGSRWFAYCRACATRRATVSQWAQFGWTSESYSAASEAQSGLCAICGRDASPLHADHDHVTGRPRELLCGSCNRALGLFRDSPENLRRAADYVEAHRK